MPHPSDDPAPHPGAESAPPPLLRNANFLKYTAVRWFNVIAIQFTTITVGWQIYEMTSDPLDLGLVGLSQFAPIFLFFLPAGLIADRMNRRAVIAACNGVHALVIGFVLYYSFSGSNEPWPIFLALLIHGAARAFYQPSLNSVLPNIVPRSQFPSAVAYTTSLGKFGHLAGPAAAGLLIALIGTWVYLLAIIGFVISVIASALLVTRREERAKRGVGFADLMGGFSYVWNKKLVLGTMSMDLVAVLFSGVIGMLPVFARDILHVGPEGLGVLRAMPAVGAVTVGLFLAQLPLRENVGRTLILSCVVVGLSSSAFALSETFWLSMLLLVLFGAADMVSTNIRQTLVQLVTPDAMRGRVSSVHSVTSNASNEIGDFRAGASAALVGIVPAVFVGGFVTVALSLAWWRIFPELRAVNRMEDAR